MNRTAASPIPSAILAGYAPQPGVADELFDASGAMRPVWAPFIAQLAGLSPEDIAARFARGEQYLRDAGVYSGSTLAGQRRSANGRSAMCRS
jgi:uncharacterized circularly permuted ATP-grasp superfamily protein